MLLLNPVNVTQAVGHSDFVETKAYANTRQKKPEHRESVYFSWDMSSRRRSRIWKTALAKSQPAAVKTPSEVCWTITGEGRGRPHCCHCWWQEHAKCEDLALAVLALRFWCSGTETSEVVGRCVTCGSPQYLQMRNWISIYYYDHLRQTSKPCDTLWNSKIEKKNLKIYNFNQKFVSVIEILLLLLTNIKVNQNISSLKDQYF